MYMHLCISRNVMADAWEQGGISKGQRERIIYFYVDIYTYRLRASAYGTVKSVSLSACFYTVKS